MTFLAPNHIAILVAAAVAYVLGALWYRIFAQPWLDAIGKTRDGVKPSAGPYIVAAVADLVIAWVLSGIMGHLGQINVRTGLISALFVWLGFVATVIATNNAFAGRNPILTLIDAGYWLLALLAMGLVIGRIGS